MNNVDMSVIIPCYNENDNVKNVYSNVIAHIPDNVNKFEIIFVNDGSTDNTRCALELCKELDPGVKIINFSINKGYGRALSAGFRSASYPYVFYIDGDGQYDFSDARKMLSLMLAEELDLVGGYRDKRADNLHRVMIARAGNICSRFILARKFKDIDCGFKLIRKKVLEKIDLKTRSGILISMEIYYKFLRNNFKISQVPVVHKKRRFGEAKGVNGKQYYRAGKDMCGLFLGFMRKKS
jgi:glycosyltransferase involved in cell wall biosynthesis